MFEHSCLCPAASFAGNNFSPFLYLVNSYLYSKSQLNYHQLCETFPSSLRQNELHSSSCMAIIWDCYQFLVDYKLSEVSLHIHPRVCQVCMSDQSRSQKILYGKWTFCFFLFVFQCGRSQNNASGHSSLWSPTYVFLGRRDDSSDQLRLLGQPVTSIHTIGLDWKEVHGGTTSEPAVISNKSDNKLISVWLTPCVSLSLGF